MKIDTTERILVIGDTHFPAHHKDYIEFLVSVRENYDLDTALHVGDVVDHHAISYHESSPSAASAGDELAIAKQSLAELSEEFPKLTISCGNHDILPARKAKTMGLPKAMIKQLNEIYETPDEWNWVPDFVEFKLKCGMTCVMQHKISTSMAAGVNKLRGASLIQGHHHFTSGVAWNQAPEWRLFFMSVGCGVDPNHPAMSYASNGVLSLPALGCGVIIDGWAAFIPMWLDGADRWNGKVP